MSCRFGSMTLFIDGEQDAIIPYTSTGNFNGVFPLISVDLIKMWDFQIDFFNGQIEKFAFGMLRVPRPKYEMICAANLLVPKPGLVGYWNMNEGADNTCAGGDDVLISRVMVITDSRTINDKK